MTDTMLECRGLTKSYHDGNRELKVLRGIDLAIAEGERVAIVGPSGAGKSTLLQIMGTLDRPTAGGLYFRNKLVTKMSARDVDRIRNKDIGFVFQFYHLLPEFTAEENVMMPALSQGLRAKECEPRAHELLERVGLSDRRTHKPGELSGGEQQRVAIARALFNRPALLLGDEPTGNLDERTGAGITDLLWSLEGGERLTMVMVTHDMSVANRADRIVHLHEGLVHGQPPQPNQATSG